MDAYDSEIADKIVKLMEEKGLRVATTTRTKFKKFADFKRIHDKRLDSIADALWEEHRFLMTYGENAVVVSEDRSVRKFALI